MRTSTTVSLSLASLALLVVSILTDKAPSKAGMGLSPSLRRTFIAVTSGSPIVIPHLITTNREVLAPDGLIGHWSVIFFGFTACPLVCPRTLAVITAVAQDPKSGISEGMVQPLFVSVDAKQDTSEVMRGYLSHFDHHILGISGSRAAIETFSRDVGASSQAVASGIDHSTSLFVIDPDGRVAGILLRPNNPGRIVADLTMLRRLYIPSQLVQ